MKRYINLLFYGNDEYALKLLMCTVSLAILAATLLGSIWFIKFLF